MTWPLPFGVAVMIGIRPILSGPASRPPTDDEIQPEAASREGGQARDTGAAAYRRGAGGDDAR
jgi:hypothetical protein